ncbi:MAG TPA: flagellar hook-basal body complex protein [Xanthomonadales bacterium]|nr:flagellar hook-basal body complex protein [Xanthomonadales bacterium]
MAFDSLFIGVTGLESYQSQIDVISNNIANVGTTGFKGQDVNFQDLIYQAQSFASAPTQTSGGINGKDAGLGVKIASIDTNYAQGGLRTTGVNTNLAMNGDGFFILRKPNGNGAPLYTRNGDFSLNSNGMLYDQASGMAVQGYMADRNGNVSQTGTPGDVTIPLGLSSQAVGTGLNPGLKFGASGDKVFDVSLGGNLDQTQWIKEAQGVQAANPGTGSPYTISTTVYDSLGNAHLAQITYSPDAAGATGGNAQVASQGALGAGNLINALSGTTGGKTISVKVDPGGTTATIADGNTTITAAPGATLTYDGATFTLGNFVPADAGVTGTINNAGGGNGLPSQVADPSAVLHAPAARWKVSVSFADGTTFDAIQNPGSINGAGVTTAATTTPTPVSSGVLGYAYFDQNGQYINTSSIEGVAAGQSITGANVHNVNNNPALSTGNQLNVRSWGTGTSNASVAPTAGGPAPQTGPIGLDFHNSTSLAGTATANVFAQNGYGAGILSNLTIGQDGTISGAFTNGQTTTLGRVAVATFQNEGGLQRVGGSDFASTANSGLAQVGTASVGRYGSIVSGSLEQSNVSIADEFTKMISAQNAYQANSKSITTASEDMQTVINLIR